MNRAAFALVSLLPLLASAPARADEAQALARIDAFSEFAVTSGTCSRIGYTVDESQIDPVSEAAAAEIEALGLPEERAVPMINAAMKRNGALFKQELAKLSAGLDDGKPIKPMVLQVAAMIDQRCQRASQDPLFSRVVHPLGEAERAAGRLAFTDSILEPAGQASWQTPRMFAKAELYFAVGACRRHLSPAEVDRYLAQFGDGSGLPERERAYYSRQFQDGIEGAARLDLDAQQCQKVISKRRVAAGQG